VNPSSAPQRTLSDVTIRGVDQLLFKCASAQNMRRAGCRWETAGLYDRNLAQARADARPLSLSETGRVWLKRGWSIYYRQTKVVGGVFRSLGQEATVGCSAYALAPQDFVTPLIRDLGAVLVKEFGRAKIFAQYMAKAWGTIRRSRFEHSLWRQKRGFIGPISHLGDMIPVMTGVFARCAHTKKTLVAVAYIGDGGMSTGAFHEGLNFAAVQRLPLIVIAEYNPLRLFHATSLQTAVRDLAEKAAGYNIPGHIVDGNDVIACYEVTKRAADFARRSGGAVLIEAKTYRRKGPRRTR